jgi:hypothetical protein
MAEVFQLSQMATIELESNTNNGQRFKAYKARALLDCVLRAIQNKATRFDLTTTNFLTVLLIQT